MFPQRPPGNPPGDLQGHQGANMSPSMAARIPAFQLFAAGLPDGIYQVPNQNPPHVGPGGGGTQTGQIMGHHSALSVGNPPGDLQGHQGTNMSPSMAARIFAFQPFAAGMPDGIDQVPNQNPLHVGPGGGGTQTGQIMGHHSALAVDNVQESGSATTAGPTIVNETACANGGPQPPAATPDGTFGQAEPANARPPAKTRRRPAKRPDGPPPPGMKWCWRKCCSWVPIERFEGRDTKGCANCLRRDQGWYRNSKKKQQALKAAQQDVISGINIPVASNQNVLVEGQVLYSAQPPNPEDGGVAVQGSLSPTNTGGSQASSSGSQLGPPAGEQMSAVDLIGFRGSPLQVRLAEQFPTLSIEELLQMGLRRLGWMRSGNRMRSDNGEK